MSYLGNIDEGKVKKQTEFCSELMARLSESVNDGDFEWIMPTRIQQDIIRLRRELNTLREMLYRY